MPSDFLFRLSTFIMLTLACLGLGYAEWDLLPEVTVVGVIVVGLLLVQFWKGEQFELSLWAANRVGLGMFFVIVGWMAYQFLNRNSLIYTLPWPASLLPYLGPIVMALMAAKMFRPKHVGDWWAFQGMGLAAIALGCALANDEGFGILLLLYTMAAVWSLLLFTYRRDGGQLPAMPNRPTATTPQIVAPIGKSGRVPGLLPGICALGLAILLAIPFFFLTPRSNTPRWSFGANQIETGYNSEQMIDLNTTGTLTSSDEVAFRAEVHNADGRIKDDLPSDQYWRGISYNDYENGQWKRAEIDGRLNLYRRASWFPPNNDFELAPRQSLYVPPELGPNAYTIDFERVIKKGEPILAAPPAWVPGEYPPVATLSDGDPRSWWQAQDATFRPSMWANQQLKYYRQVQAEPTEPGLGSPMELRVNPDPQSMALRRPFASFQQVNLPKVRDWTIERIEALADNGQLDQEIIERAKSGFEFQIEASDYEAVARALCHDLQSSPEYRYTVELTRDDPDSDPVEDFLLRTKSGHCQRFASALALALRSVGVPTVYVLGFHGYDLDDDGTLMIRQSDAHAWVEVLIPRPRSMPLRRDDDRPLAEQAVVWHWLMLDPTPGDVPTETVQGSWLTAFRHRSAQLFNDFIVGYNDKKHQEVSSAFWDKLLRTRTLISIALITVALISIVWMARRGLRMRVKPRHRQHHSTGTVWYDEYLALLRQQGWKPDAGATPREYAQSVTQQLQATGHPDEIVRIPLEVTERLHQARYAERPLSPEMLTMIQQQLVQLRQAFKISDNAVSVTPGAL